MRHESGSRAHRGQPDGPRHRPMSVSTGVRNALRLVPKAKTKLAILVASSVVSGFAEGALLGVVVQMALQISNAESIGDIALGPLRADLSFRALLILGFGLVAVRFVLQNAAVYVPARMSADAQATLRDATFSGYLHADWTTQSQQREGELQEFLTGHTSRFAHVLLVFNDMVSSLLTFLALMATAVVVNPVAAVTSIIAGAMLFLALRPFASASRRLSKKRAGVNLEYAQAITESVRVSQEVVTFGVTEAHRVRAATVSNRASRYQFLSQFMGGLGGIAYQTAALALVLGGLAAVHATKAEDFATFGASVLIIVRALGYSQGVQSNHQRLSELLPYVEDVEQQLARYESRRDRSGHATFETIDSIAFDHVCYAYPGGDDVLADLTLRVNAGEIIGIAGPSGAGKSTIVQLLLRLRQPTAGTLMVNGVDVTTLDLRQWRRRVSYVPQESRLIAGTVADNIRFHRADITSEEIEDAARLANVHRDVMMMPKGFDTVISERDRAVSGGQRQRLCIARALVGSPEVLVLDEPTSSLDVQAESVVQETLSALKGKRIIFVVAHRLSTLRICDRILILRDGRIEAFASNTDLLDVSAFWSEAMDLTGAPAATARESA